MNAKVVKLTIEKMTSKEVKARFLRTTPSRPKVCRTLPLALDVSVS